MASVVIHPTVTAAVGSDWHSLAPRLICEHLLETGSGAVAEVGVWLGELSERILAIPSVTQHIMVDPWRVVYGKSNDHWCVYGPGTDEAEMESAYAIAHAKMERYGDRAVIHRVPSVEGAARILDGSLAVVIIDALHFKDQVMEDIQAWRPKLRPGGLMIGDDYSHWFPGVQLGVEAIFGTHHQVLGQTWWTYPNEGGRHGD